MQTNYLRHFIAVAEKGTISAAAASCFITPQGLSRSISALESELGCPIFEKSYKGMALTEFGRSAFAGGIRYRCGGETHDRA